MKKLWLSILLCGYMCTLFAVSARLSARPSRPISGELFTLEITLDGEEKFSLQLPELPDGLRVSKNISSSSFNTTVINGKRTASAVYGVAAIADKPGKYTIAPFTLLISGKKIQTNPLEITVRDAAQLPAGEKFSAKLTITPDRAVYVGEVVRADVELFLPGTWQLLAMPEFDVSGFGDPLYLEIGKKGEKFVLAEEPARYNGGMTVNFAAMFQVQKSGTFTPLCQLKIRTGQRTNDFFSPIREQMRLVTAPSDAKLTVLPLPPVPVNCIDTGLVGTWQISAKFSKDELKTGDLGELILNFKGSATVPAFHPPQLDIPGTRVYPAEVNKESNLQEFTVKYPFVAVKSGKITVSLNLAYFDVKSGKYAFFRRDLHFTARPGAVSASAENTVSIAPAESNEEKSAVNADLLTFTLLPPGKKLRLPLIKNVMPWIAGLLICGMAAIIFSMKKERCDTKKDACRRQLAHLIKAVKHQGVEPLLTNGRETIAAALDLAPGATFEEIAEKADDPEIAELLRQLSASGFAPGTEKEVKVSDPALKNLIKFLKKLSVFAVFALFAVFPARLSADYQTAADAFDQGRYREAAEEFARQLNTGNAVDPALLYDLGCAEFMLGNQPQAHLYFTRAHLLEPWKNIYRQAMERSKSELNLPAQQKTWSTHLRHFTMFLRPDIGLLIAAGIFAAAGVLWLRRRKMAAGIFVSIQVIMVLLMLIILSGAAYQRMTSYSFDQAMVTAVSAPLRAVPAESADAPASLPGGSIVQITGENGNFCQVRSDGISGWINKKDAERIFPYKIWL